MALGDLTKQIAQQALLTATTKEPAAPPAPDHVCSIFMGQINAMQKALKEDEELVVLFQNGSERVRIMEIFAPSRQVAVLSGVDPDRNTTRIISAVESLQLVCKVMKVAPGAKPTRVALVTPKH
jgi:hypothetical protein